MAYTCSAAAVAGGKTTVTGTGYANGEVILSAAFVATDNKHRYVESYRVPVVAGAISYDVKVPITAGTLTVKAYDTAGTLLATAIDLSV